MESLGPELLIEAKANLIVLRVALKGLSDIPENTLLMFDTRAALADLVAIFGFLGLHRPEKLSRTAARLADNLIARGSDPDATAVRLFSAAVERIETLISGEVDGSVPIGCDGDITAALTTLAESHGSVSGVEIDSASRFPSSRLA